MYIFLVYGKAIYSVYPHGIVICNEGSTMKKRHFGHVAVLLVLCLMILNLSACGGESLLMGNAEDAGKEAEDAVSESKQIPEGKVFQMRIGHAQSEISPRHRSLLVFKEMVEEKTNGGVRVEIFPAGELGNENEMTVAVSEGTLEAVRGGDLEFVPKTDMLGLPMIADNLEQARTLCYSDMVAEMLSSVEKDYNMKVLAVGDDSGFRQITNNVRPITKPDDMKGLKMRSVLEVIDLSMQEFGATTETIPFTELYDALASGRVDGQENPLALIDGNKFYEVQKYCTIIDYMFFAELMYVNLSWWESLPAEYQQILEQAAKEMMILNGEITDKENESYVQHIQANGCEIYDLTDEERNAFKPLAENVWKTYIDNGRIAKSELERMLEVIGKKIYW